jgi:hypothetical protein
MAKAILASMMIFGLIEIPPRVINRDSITRGGISILVKIYNKRGRGLTGRGWRLRW